MGILNSLGFTHLMHSPTHPHTHTLAHSLARHTHMHTSPRSRMNPDTLTPWYPSAVLHQRCRNEFRGYLEALGAQRAVVPVPLKRPAGKAPKAPPLVE
jgi:hypothetical protein